jgi:L-alanine-DL-glutamate epimerase-like enolase superfamily enzyme
MAPIKSFETWVCTTERDTPHQGQGHPFARLHRTILLKITDEDNNEGIGTCLAERSVQASLGFLRDVVAPVVLGRDAHDREAIWLDLWTINRHLVSFPIYLTGCVDVALWDLAAKRAGLPLYQYLGATRTSLPVYYSSLFMDTESDYLADLKRCLSLGFKAYKVHCKEKMPEVFTSIREAAGPNILLMADPASDMTFEQALRFGRHLEKLNYYWLEEPFRDWNIEKYAKLTAALEIPVAGTEATTGGPWGVAQAIARNAVDIVRADVSWKSGITGTLKIAHMAEAFGMNCELHSTLMGPMDIANLHVSCSIGNCEYFELHTSHAVDFQFPMKQPYPIKNGIIHVPQKPGLGIDIDWDKVDDATHQHQHLTR